MQFLTKFLLVASAFAILGAAAAQADDQQLTNRLVLQSEQNPAPQRSSTVAVYAGNSGAVGNRDPQDPVSVYEFHPNGHGQLIGMYRAVVQ
ncbi:MAG TPA: hypothetical protein VGM54_18390 [Chthoniobacter sp.]|jgi:hypothetical protein